MGADGPFHARLVTNPVGAAPMSYERGVEVIATTADVGAGDCAALSEDPNAVVFTGKLAAVDATVDDPPPAKDDEEEDTLCKLIFRSTAINDDPMV